MDKLRALTLVCSCAILAACSPNGGTAKIIQRNCYENESGAIVICDRARGYTYWYPDWIENNQTIENPVEVYTYDLSTCPLLGVTNTVTEQRSGIEVQWGKVDFPLDYSETELDPDCRPYKPMIAAYALCSEKDGKAVVICIQQVTDNPELAEEIFRTFRWVE